MVAFCLFSSTLILLIVSGKDISWFKDTTYHQENIVAIDNDWGECVHWSNIYNSVGAPKQLNSDQIFNLSVSNAVYSIDTYLHFVFH